MVLSGGGLRYIPASDRSLLVSLGDVIAEDTQRRVTAVTRALMSPGIEGVVNVHPAYTSVLVVFDPLRTDHQRMEQALRALDLDDALSTEVKTVEIPVRYGGESGPDLDDVAAIHGMTPGHAAELHASAEYTVAFLGFIPGFAYLSGLPGALATPRLTTPRGRVPAGSVGIAGAQTGVYPVAAPGGWKLIGRTPLTLFDPAREPMSLLQTGDRVRFIPLGRAR